MITLTLLFLLAMTVYTIVIVIVNLVRAKRKPGSWTQIQPEQDEEFVSYSVTPMHLLLLLFVLAITLL